MKFKLETIGVYYEDAEKRDLENLGFKFYRLHGTKTWVKKSDKVFISFGGLQELLAFVDTWGKVLISNNLIKIYDICGE